MGALRLFHRPCGSPVLHNGFPFPARGKRNGFLLQKPGGTPCKAVGESISPRTSGQWPRTLGAPRQFDGRIGMPRGCPSVVQSSRFLGSSLPRPSTGCGIRKSGRRQVTTANLFSWLPWSTKQPDGEAEEEVEEVDVVIVGAGLAGLTCARELYRAGLSFKLLEASDDVGGRVRTDVTEDGFRLDRGFQIFITAYPECKAQLDYSQLDLRPFYSGALVRHQGQFHRVADPCRHPLDGLESLSNPIGSVLDKILVGLLRLKVLVVPDASDLLARPETTTVDRLQKEGFSESMIQLFFRPFLGGIFFDQTLFTSSRLMEFVIRMLALGSNTLPALGIGSIPAQIAESLPESSIALRSWVQSINRGTPDGTQPPCVTVSGGRRYIGRMGVVVAVEAPEAAHLLGEALEAKPSHRSKPRGTVCIYYAAPRAPIEEPVLLLNGDSGSHINNMCFPSSVSASYAPPGQTLVSVSTVGSYPSLSEAELEAVVKTELEGWFGVEEVAKWRHLRTYRIPYAQPSQKPPTEVRRDVRLGEGLYVCGDHRDTATFNGAMLSGRRAAEAVIADAALSEKQLPKVESPTEEPAAAAADI